MVALAGVSWDGAVTSRPPEATPVVVKSREEVSGEGGL